MAKRCQCWRNEHAAREHYIENMECRCTKGCKYCHPLAQARVVPPDFIPLEIGKGEQDVTTGTNNNHNE